MTKHANKKDFKKYKNKDLNSRKPKIPKNDIMATKLEEAFKEHFANCKPSIIIDDPLKPE